MACMICNWYNFRLCFDGINYSLSVESNENKEDLWVKIFVTMLITLIFALTQKNFINEQEIMNVNETTDSDQVFMNIGIEQEASTSVVSTLLLTLSQSGELSSELIVPSSTDAVLIANES